MRAKAQNGAPTLTCCVVPTPQESAIHIRHEVLEFSRLSLQVRCGGAAIVTNTLPTRTYAHPPGGVFFSEIWRGFRHKNVRNRVERGICASKMDRH